MWGFLSRAFDPRHSPVALTPFGRTPQLHGQASSGVNETAQSPLGKMLSRWILIAPVVSGLLAWLVGRAGNAIPFLWLVAIWLFPVAAYFATGTLWAIRRLHDSGHSGFQLLIPAILFTGIAAAMGAPLYLLDEVSRAAGWDTPQWLGLILLITCGGGYTTGFAIPGITRWGETVFDSPTDPGHNKYGPPPV
jgi:uncharacterized membrane protein YhaH (DUF805 family)